MNVRRMRWAWLLIGVICSIGWAQTPTAPKFPALSGRVVDQANILDTATRQRIDTALAAFESASSIQLVVATFPDLQGYAIDDFGYQLGRNWGIGQQGKNNGVLLIVAQAERKVRIEVGYGLESKLTDALSENIIQSVILPQFKSGQFAAGVEQGSAAIIQALNGEYQPIPTRRDTQSGRPNAPPVFFVLAFIVIALLRSIGRRGGFYPGGFGGGGGGGGFRGGGGGFGGGGASGGW
jgi:uncharacterized protein